MTERLCQNCQWWVRGYRGGGLRPDDTTWFAEYPEGSPVMRGDCRNGPPDSQGFPSTHQDDWCRWFTRKD